MKYLEELNSGDLFTLMDNRYLITKDSKLGPKDNIRRWCVSILDGGGQWIDDNTMVEDLDIYLRDNDGNIIPLKERKNEYSEKNKNIC